MPKPNNSDFAMAEVSSYHQHDKRDVLSPTVTTIPEKFKGTKNDQNDMVLLGKKQVLRRNFKFTSILGFASTGGSCQEVRTASTPRIDA
jgi:choline transport protein